MHFRFELANINDLKEDKCIGFEDFKKECSRFAAYSNLEESLGLLGNQNAEYISRTDDYRNKNEHKLPPSLEIGLTNFVNIKKGLSDDTRTFISDYIPNLDYNFDGAFTVEFGGVPPLKSKDMIPILLEQGNRMYDAVNKYWNLVLEQFEVFNRPII